MKKRNLDPNVIFRFSDDEFNSLPTESATPKAQTGLKISVVDTA